MMENLLSLKAESIWLAIPGVAGGLIAGLFLMFYRDLAAHEPRLQDPKFTDDDRLQTKSVKTTVFWLGVTVLGSILPLLTIVGGASIVAAAVSVAAGLVLGACVERAVWLRNSRENDEPQGDTRSHGQIGHGIRYLISFRWLL
jgi:hypothetical protein